MVAQTLVQSSIVKLLVQHLHAALFDNIAVAHRSIHLHADKALVCVHNEHTLNEYTSSSYSKHPTVNVLQVLCIYLAHPWSISSGSSGISSDTTLARSHCSSTKQPVSSALTRFCSRLFRRRCAVVQQSLWQDPRGIYCLTFNSLAQEELQQQQQQQDCCLIAPSSDQADNSSSNSSVHSLCKGDHAHPHSSSRSLPGVGDSCRAAPQQQQQMRHRWSSHPGKPMSSKQQQQHRQHGQSVQLHACCHQQGSDRRSNVARTRAKQQHQHHNQQRAQLQPQQRQRSATVLLLLQLFALLLSWLGSLLGLLGSLVGLQGSSSSSSRSWGLFGPVHVSVVGGFTVAGLDGGVDDEGPVTETLVTSILKVRGQSLIGNS
jgi:hypothetical protein